MIKLDRITTIDISKYVPFKLSNESFEWKDIGIFASSVGSGKSIIGLQIYNAWFNHDIIAPMKVDIEYYEEQNDNNDCSN